MQTTCPECRTTFRVSQEHLGARRGLVRCGHCNAVFNAYDTLLPELEEPPAEDAPASADIAPSPDTFEFVPTVAANPEPEEQTPAAMLAEAYAEVDLPEHAETLSHALSDNPIAEDTVTLSAPAVVSVDKAADKAADILLQPLHVLAEKPPRTWKTVSYASLATLLLGLLLLQAAYFLRAELATAAPATRPALEWLCQSLRCSVPLPRQLNQDAIASSSLEHDPEQKSRVRLTFLLVNRSGQTQAWPQITLTLSDMREAPVAQQVFRPQTYLPPGVKLAGGMPDRAEREIRLDLDIGNLVASGYALSLAYP